MTPEYFRTRDADVLANRIAAHLAAMQPCFADLSAEGRRTLAGAIKRVVYDCAELRVLLNTTSLEDPNG
jgi:hypothetical protein